MKKKTITSGKLQLRKETISLLSPQAMAYVYGGENKKTDKDPKAPSPVPPKLPPSGNDCTSIFTTTK